MSLFFKLLTACLITLASSVAAFECSCPANVSYDAYNELLPYLMPSDHPAKKTLDRLFSSPDVLISDQALKKAGFKQIGARGYSKAKILKHKKLKKYIIKAFTDDQEAVVDFAICKRRIDGSHVIRAVIDRHQLHHLFKVPQKWIYQVPRKQESLQEKNFILIAEDMEIFDSRGNYIMWNGRAYITKEILDALFLVLTEAGLIDSVFIDNIPFSLDEKIAFVDTEHFHKWPVPYGRLTCFLAKKLQFYWMDLILKNP